MGIIGLVALLFYAASMKKGRAPEIREAVGGWHDSIAAALKESVKTGKPALIVVTRGGWGGYERAVFDREETRSMIEALPRAMLDGVDSELEHLGLERSPGMLLLTRNGKVITRIGGARDPVIIHRAIRRGLEDPVPYQELADASDPAKHLRYVEALIEMDQFDSAAAEAARYLEAPEPHGAAGRFHYGYAQAELGNRDEAVKQIDRYLAEQPAGEFTAQARWIRIVLALQGGDEKGASEQIGKLMSEAPDAPYTRQAVTAYALNYLAAQKGRIRESEEFLTKRIEEGGTWRGDFLLARANLFFNTERLLEGIADLEEAARSGERSAAENAQGQLVEIVGRLGDPGMVSRIILAFQKLARDSSDTSTARLNLAKLYLVQRDSALAIAEARGVAEDLHATHRDEAMLLLATMELELNIDPAAAVAVAERIVREYPRRETAWPARYLRAKALFFSGDAAGAKSAFEELAAYFKGRRFVSSTFALVLGGPAPPEALENQAREFLSRLKGILNEENGPARFSEFMGGVVSAARGDIPAGEAAMLSYADRYPASSLTDDAYMELAKMQMQSDQRDSALVYLDRIVSAYKGSDQFETAQQLIQLLNRGR